MKTIIYTVSGSDILWYMLIGKHYTVDQVLANHMPSNALNARIVDFSAMPDVVLRDAWEDTGSSVAVNMVKGKDIANNIRRGARTKAFAANLEIIQNDSMGIPLKAGQSVTTAKAENSNYKKDIDDVAQTAISNATNEADLLLSVKDLIGV